MLCIKYDMLVETEFDFCVPRKTKKYLMVKYSAFFNEGV